MSISLEPIAPPSGPQHALDLLKGKENPFEVLAAGVGDGGGGDAEEGAVE